MIWPAVNNANTRIVLTSGSCLDIHLSTWNPIRINSGLLGWDDIQPWNSGLVGGGPLVQHGPYQATAVAFWQDPAMELRTCGRWTTKATWPVL